MMLLSTPVLVPSLWISQFVVDCSPLTHPMSGDLSMHKSIKRSIVTRLDYREFQISDGLSGNCSKKAESVFLTPYNLTQVTVLNTGSPNPIGLVNGVAIDKTDLDICKKMSQVATEAEDSFNTAINQGGGPKTSLGKELQNGKICNKVLKLTEVELHLLESSHFIGAVLCLQMEIQLGVATSARRKKLAEKITDLQENVLLDRTAKGQKQRSVEV